MGTVTSQMDQSKQLGAANEAYPVRRTLWAQRVNSQKIVNGIQLAFPALLSFLRKMSPRGVGYGASLPQLEIKHVQWMSDCRLPGPGLIAAHHLRLTQEQLAEKLPWHSPS